MNNQNMIDTVTRISGVNPRKCMRCGKCSASCPAYDEMEYHPHQFVSMVENGRIEELLSSKGIYTCLSCFACVERCPRNVEPAKLIEAVRNAVERQQGMDHLKPERIPEILDGELPQQAIAAAFRKYKKVRRERNAEDRRLRMLVRQQHCRDRRRGKSLAGACKRAGRCFLHQLSVHVFPDRPADDSGEDPRIRADRRGHLFLCSPRMHEQTFRKTCEKAGLNPYMVEIANIREQCSWIHKDKEAGTEKAIILGRAAIAKVHLNAPLTAGSSPVTKRALVIGGGIAGIQTALDIAEAGFEVDIVEKQPTIGGKMTQIDKTFPTLDCAACILTPKMVDCAQNEKNPHLFLLRDRIRGRLRRQLPREDPPQSALRQGRRLHRLRSLHRKVPAEEGPERIQPRHGQPPRHLYPLCTGRAEGRDHRPELLQHAQKRQVRCVRKGLFRRRDRLQADRHLHRAGIRRHRRRDGLQPHRPFQIR